MRHKTFFDEENRLDKLTRQGDPLVKLKKKINWGIFEDILNDSFSKEPPSRGGRPPYDNLMMFKILILQRYYNLSDERMEFEILNRLNFNRFLDLGLQDNVPDRTTIWIFREHLIKKNKIEELFNRLTAELERNGLLVKEGSKVMVDASFVDVPKQRNTREENKTIKEGKVPDKWKGNKKKISQKDTDASWTKKNDEVHYGYKNHIKANEKSKLIEKYEVSCACVHDSRKLEDLVDDEDKGREFYGDSAYSGKPIADLLNRYGIISKTHEKGYRNNPLTKEQKSNNREKSKIRARVEHVFGFIENNMNGSFIKSIGIKRAEANIGLMNITYNLFRFIQLQGT